MRKKCCEGNKLLSKACNSQSCAKEELSHTVIYVAGSECKSFYGRIILSLGRYFHKAMNKDQVITVRLALQHNFSR